MDCEPFVVGDLDPTGSYVHVMDDVTLDILLAELDTVVDFTEYLTKKVAFLRSGRLRSAAGEQDLLAYYSVRVNEDGDHDFVEDSGTAGAPLDVKPGLYARLDQDPRNIARREANAVSYFWDRLIESFTRHMIGGTSIVLDGYDYDLRTNELGVRHMALQRRVVRRGLGEAVASALYIGAKEEMFCRRMVVPPGLPDCETGFFVLTMKYPDRVKREVSYDDYRRARANAAIICAQGLLVRFPHLERVVGISCEPAAQDQGGSEDLVYMEQAQWTDDDRHDVEENCRRLGLFQAGVEARQWHQEEFPDVRRP